MYQPDFREFLFKTPSKNIYCAAYNWGSLNDGSIDCTVVSTGTKQLLPKHWILEAQGRVKVYRPGDAPIDHNTTVAYGRTLKLGLFRCSSMTVGLKSWSLLSGRGFFLSRERQYTF